MSNPKGKARESYFPAEEASSSSSYLARRARTKETDENDFVRDNPLDEYIRNVLTANSTYEDISKAMQKEVGFGSDMQPFLRDLLDMHDDKSAPDLLLADFILGYRSRKPCILDEDGLKKLRIIYHEYSKRKIAVPTQRLDSHIPFANESLEDYIHRNSQNVKPISPSCFTIEGDDTQPPHEARFSDDSLDALLGIAGFLPEEQLVAKAKPLSDAIESIKLNVLPEGSGIYDAKARVTLGRDSSDSEILYKTQRFVKVVELFARLHFVVNELQRTGRLNESLVYWREYQITPRYQRGGYAAGQSSSKPGMTSVEYRHVAVSIAVSFLDELVEVLHKTHAELLRIEKPELPFGALQDRVANLVADAPGIPLMGLSVPFFIGGVLGALGAFGKDKKLTIDQALKVVASKTKDILKKHEIPLIRNEYSQPDASTDIEHLRDIAMVGQFLCLVLQSRFRDAEGPLEFDKLVDRPFGQFELCGFPTRKDAIRGSIRQSCIPERDVLVFGLQTVDKSSDVLVATPAQLLNICTTAKPLFRKSIQGSPTDAEFVGILIDDGIILPDISSERLEEWQWHQLRDIDIDMLVNLQNAQAYKPRATPRFTAPMHIRQYKTRGQAHHAQPYVLAPDRAGDDVSPITEQMSAIQMEEHPDSATEDTTSLTSGGDQYSTTATSISGGPGGGDGEQPAGTEGGSIASNLRCLWESHKADKERRKSFRPKLRQRGTRRGRWEVSSAQLQLGIQASAARVSASLSTQKRSKNSYRNDLFTRQQIFRDLESQCCVVLSLHTGVMSRVPLRYVIAYMLEKRYVTATDIGEPILEKLIFLLKSDTPYLEWQHTIRLEGGPSILGKLNVLMKMAIDELYWTGMVDKSLHMLWPGDPGDMLWLETRATRWLKALTDTDRNTTLACVVSDCRDTPDCRCLMRHSTVAERAGIKWEAPNIFRLSTQVYTLKVSNYEPTSTSGGLLLNKTYWISSTKLNLLGEVIGRTQDPETQRTVYYVSVRNSSLPGWIKKYLSSYETIFEAADGDGVDYCVIGSGKEFEESIFAFLATQRA